MLSNLQDAPPIVKQENSPQPMKWIIKTHKMAVDFAKSDEEVSDDGSIKSSTNNVAPETIEFIETLPSVDDSPSMVKKKFSRSLQPTKKNRKRALHRAEVDIQNGRAEYIRSTSNQLVLYNPGSSKATEHALPLSEHTESYSSYLQNMVASKPSGRVLPSVGAFTVQCANCFKWRLIPTKEKYEEIREHIWQRPFTCDEARAWRPDITCDDPADISQDGSRLWAIDKPNIAQPPHGWERQLRIRGEGSTKFADVYYVAPSGKKLRSMVEIQKYLLEHPGYIEEGVKISQFSFQIPRPLQENYVRKRPPRLANPLDSGSELPMHLEPAEVHPLSWVEPTDKGLQAPPCSGGSGNYNQHSESPLPSPPEKKKSTKLKIYIRNCSRGNSSVTVPTKEEL